MSVDRRCTAAGLNKGIYPPARRLANQSVVSSATQRLNQDVNTPAIIESDPIVCSVCDIIDGRVNPLKSRRFGRNVGC